MKESVKKILVVAMTLSLMCSSFAFAVTKNNGTNLEITNAYVKGNSYKSLARGKKKDSTKSLKVYVENMRKDNGSDSDYRYSWWQVVSLTDGITLNSGVKVTKGNMTYIPLSRKTGTSKQLSVAVKGNTSDLDTIIDATIYKFNK